MMTDFAADSLSFSFDGKNLIFRDLSLQLHPGEILVLLGANGAGKTTLMRTLAGHLQPTSGQVVLDGLAMSQWSPREVAKRLALMPQFERRDSAISVREMVRLGRAAHRGWWLPLTADDDRQVEQAIESTGMTELADRPLTQLSGGQWRRAILARSLAQDASILLLDEPTSGLDLKHQFDCLRQVHRLVKERQLIAVLSLHDLQQAAMFADRIALLADRQILSLGDCETVLTAERIEQAYGIQVAVVPDPIHGRPLVIPLEPLATDQPSGDAP